MGQEIDWLVVVPMTLKDDPIEQNVSCVKVHASTISGALNAAEAAVEKCETFDTTAWEMSYSVAGAYPWAEVVQIRNDIVF
jgi:hypothetical protein